MLLHAFRLFPLIALFTFSAAADLAPAVMRAARIHAAGGPETLRIESVPVPKAAAGEVLVRVHFASVNAFTMAEAAAYPTVAVAAWRYLIQAPTSSVASVCSCRAARVAQVR